MYIDNTKEAIKNHSNIVNNYINRFGIAELEFLGFGEKIITTKKGGIKKYEIGDNEIIKIKISPKSLDLDGEKIVKTLNKKVKKNEKLTDDEIVKLAYSGYCSPQSKTKIVYKKAVEILSKTPLTPQELESVEYHMCLLYSKLSNSRNYKQMNEIFKNGYPAYQKGMESLIIKITRTLMKKGQSPESISKFVKMPPEIIKILGEEESAAK